MGQDYQSLFERESVFGKQLLAAERKTLHLHFLGDKHAVFRLPLLSD